jgi:predicted DNA-binding protein (MmcQ/YjbR family)
MQAELDARGRKLLEKFRRIVLALPETVETESFGHPWFRAGGPDGKMITVFGGEGERHTACFKVGKTDMALFLNDSRLIKTPYIGNHGWVSLELNEHTNWEEVAELVKSSYRNNAPKKLAARLKE